MPNTVWVYYTHNVVLGTSFCAQIMLECTNFSIYVHWQLFQSFLKGMLDILLSFRHTVLGHSIPTDMFTPKEGKSRVNGCQKVCALKVCSDFTCEYVHMCMYMQLHNAHNVVTLSTASNCVRGCQVMGSLIALDTWLPR